MYFLGIDGGGTKTKVYIIDNNQNIVYQGDGGPSSIDTVSNDETIKSINNATTNFFNQPKYHDIVFTSVFAGLGGVPDKEAQLVLKEILKDIKGVDKTTLIIARSDMENALASGLLFDEGITLIAGTGMVAYGKNRDNQEARASGLGYKEGDLGSSYSLGLMAIQMVARALDYRYDNTAFTTELARDLSLKTPADVAKLCEDWHQERTKVAGLAPYVTKHADLGDPLAIKIADKMSYELALAVNAVNSRLQIKKPTLVIVGSLGNTKGYFRDRLHENIKSFINDIEIISSKVDPGHAAALLAFNHYQKLK